MRILSIILGILLLLPGLCSIIVPITIGEDSSMLPITIPVFLVGMAITWLAFWLISKGGKPR
jgi:hypothetical protein